MRDWANLALVLGLVSVSSLRAQDNLPLSYSGLLLIPQVGAASPTKSCKAPDAFLVEFSGEVNRGQLFEKDVGSGLLFRLWPSADPVIPGWTIEIRSKAEPKHEFSYAVSPPYRSWNPRYLDVSYSNTAKDSVAIREREFNFVLSDADFERVAVALDRILWSYGHTEEEMRQAEKTLATVKMGKGKLRIIDSRVGGNDQSHSGWIEWIRVEVELCIPKAPKR